MKITKVFEKTLKHFNNDDIRIIFSYGGSSSSKTISILQILLLYALKHKNKTITIVSQTIGKIKKGPLKDFKKIVLSQDGMSYLNSKKHFNKTELIYTLSNGSIMQFISADSEDKIIGIRTDILYFDELNHIGKNIYDQLSIRTSHKILASWNPKSLFYANKDFERKDVAVIHSTYHDNQYVPEAIVKELIEKGRNNKNFRRVYLEGKPGILEGLIFEEDINYYLTGEPKNKKIKKVVYGLDYGYIDPTAIVKLTMYEDFTIFIETKLYESGLDPQQLKDRMDTLNIGRDRIIAESARPELTNFLYKHGYNIHKVKKTTIIDGINKMYIFKMFINKDDKHLINELRNYGWMKDKNDLIIEKPIDDFNHLIDAIRYAQTILSKSKTTLKIY